MLGIATEQDGFLEMNDMSNKLYVGNLSYSVTDADLHQWFAQFGVVASAKVITDRDTGRSKGFAFVEMSGAEEARAAIAALDGADRDGRQLTVNEARPREERGGNGGSFRHGNRERRENGAGSRF